MIKINHLKKSYGNIEALKGISIEVAQGEIVGFLGPNGAGKSTTLKIIAGYLEADDGQVFVNEIDYKDQLIELKRLIGYLPELNPLYYEMIVYDYLKFISDIRGLSHERFIEQLKQVSKKCGIDHHLHLSIGTLSKGYKQRVGLAQAILHDPPILILDEPTNGLDPNQIIEIRQLIRDLGKEKTLIISSHILQEVQAICDRIIIINEGLIVADANKNQLLKGIENCQSIDISITKGEFDLNKFKQRFSEFKIKDFKITDEQIQMIIESYQKEDIRVSLSEYLSEHKCHILELKQKHYSLEDIFHQLTQNLSKTETGEQ